MRGAALLLIGALLLAMATVAHSADFDLDSPSKTGTIYLDSFGGDPVVASEVGAKPADMQVRDDVMCDSVNEETGDYVIPMKECSRECMHNCRTPMCSMGCICGCQGPSGLRAELVAQLRQKGPRFSALAARLGRVQVQVGKGRRNPARNPRFQAHARRQEALRLAAVHTAPAAVQKQLGARRVGQARAAAHHKKAAGGKWRYKVPKVDLATAPDASGFSWGTEGGRFASPGRHEGVARGRRRAGNGGSAHAEYGAEVAGIMARDSPKAVDVDDTRWWATSKHEKDNWWSHAAKSPY